MSLLINEDVELFISELKEYFKDTEWDLICVRHDPLEYDISLGNIYQHNLVSIPRYKFINLYFRLLPKKDLSTKNGLQQNTDSEVGPAFIFSHAYILQPNRITNLSELEKEMAKDDPIGGNNLKREIESPKKFELCRITLYLEEGKDLEHTFFDISYPNQTAAQAQREREINFQLHLLGKMDIRKRLITWILQKRLSIITRLMGNFVLNYERDTIDLERFASLLSSVQGID